MLVVDCVLVALLILGYAGWFTAVILGSSVCSFFGKRFGLGVLMKHWSTWLCAFGCFHVMLPVSWVCRVASGGQISVVPTVPQEM